MRSLWENLPMQYTTLGRENQDVMIPDKHGKSGDEYIGVNTMENRISITI